MTNDRNSTACEHKGKKEEKRETGTEEKTTPKQLIVTSYNNKLITK
jgi:hypothetical protein